jgi:hypothetical protein
MSLLLAAASPIMTTAGFVRAEPPQEAPVVESRAEQLFREGRAAMRADDFMTACDRFTDSLELEETPGTLINLAICEQRLRRDASARAHYEAFLAQATATDRRRALAEASLRSLPTEGTAVDPSREADPGVAVSNATTPPTPTAPKEADAASGTVANDTSPIAARNGALLYGAAAVTGAALVVAVVAGANAIHAKNIVEEHCPNRICDAEGESAAAAGRRNIVVTNVSSLIALAGIAVTVWQLTLDERPQSTTRVSIGASPLGARLELSHAF